MPTNRPEQPIHARQAYLGAIREDPGAQAGLARAQAQLRAFGAAVRAVRVDHGPIFELIRHELAEIKRQYDAELAAVAEQAGIELAAAHAEWARVYGVQYPETIEDWKELAMHAGVDPNRLLVGKWTLRDMAPIIQGFLKSQRDKHVAAPTGATSPGIPNAKKCRPSDQRAYLAYVAACRMMTGSTSTKDAYQYVRTHGDAGDAGSLPTLKSWQRQVRAGRAAATPPTGP